MLRKGLFFLTLMYLCLSTILLLNFLIRPDHENWLQPFILFNLLTFNGWLYLLSIILLIYLMIRKKNLRKIDV
jgi:hypothetical protein